MRIRPEQLAKRITQQLLLQGRMISIELQITPQEAGRDHADLYGVEIHVTRPMSPHTCAALRDTAYD